MRKLSFAAAVLLLACAVVFAAEKLSEQARQKVESIKTDLQKRTREQPLSFDELCWLEGARLDKEKGYEERDPLQSLRHLRYGLRRKIRELNPFWKPPEEPEKRKEPEKEVKRVYRQYDVSDIVLQAPDRPAPTIGFGMGNYLQGSTIKTARGGIVDLGDGDSGIGAGFDWEKIEELFCRFLPEDADYSVRYTGGRLFCYLPEDLIPRIESLLAKMRACSGYAINIEVKYIRTTAQYLSELAKKGDGSAIYLSREAESQLLSDAAQKKDVEIVTSSEVMAADGQTVHLREGQQVSLLMDYDINTVGIPTLQPVVRVVNEGLICQFRPQVMMSGKLIDINVLASLSGLRKDMRKGKFMGGEIVFPSMRMSRLRTNVQVPSGTAVLVGGTAATAADGEGDSHRFVVYLKPTLAQKGK